MLDDAEAPDQPALRRDAERNRERILDAAGRLIGERGLEISHDEIAREAHVGMGTVYRRFPTREHLFDALYEGQLDAMVAVAEEAARLADPGGEPQPGDRCDRPGDDPRDDQRPRA